MKPKGPPPGKKLVNTSPNFGKKGAPTETGRDAAMAAASGRGGDRKSQDFHMQKAGQHMVKALERRLAERDK